MHPWPFEASFDDVFVGTLHHARADWPALLSEHRILHQRLSLAQVFQMRPDSFLLGKLAPQTISQTQKRTGTSMFEDMQASVEYVRRKTHASLL